MSSKLALSELYTACDPELLDFQTTDELKDLQEIIGQERALQALHFGVGIRQPGYNLYVLGPTGLGKHAVVREYLESQAGRQPPPMDWVYVNNFARPSRPNAISLNSGEAISFRNDMHQLVEDLRTAIPAAFEAEEYQARVQEIEDELKHKLESAFNSLAQEAESHQITLLRTPHGFAFAPVKDKEVISPKDFEKLPEKDQRRIEETMAVLEEKLTVILRQQPQWQREARAGIKQLNQEIVMFAAGHLIDELKNKYQHNKAILAYLDAVQDDVINNSQDFRHDEENPEPMGLALRDTPTFRRYDVNVIIEQGKAQTAPVIYEDQPNYANLIGAVEHTAHLGALQTDFTLIKAGALHRANGGYLILDVLKLLSEPYAWEGLKRALSSHEIKIQSLGQIYSLISTVSLEPEPIPLDVKVVLIGDRIFYYLLHAYDPEFKQLFKVAADFDDSMPRNRENQQVYARMIATLLRRDKLRPFERQAVARVIEYAARYVEDAEKLSTYVMDIADLLREADHFAELAGHAVTQHADVQQAIDAWVYRNDRLRQHMHEQILRGSMMIDTEGSRTGQVNGLAVLQLGDFAFATPTRITATARLGKGQVIDIEREAKLGGAIHTKGVFILSAFLGARYAKDRPLSLSASLVFEQSYGKIEGDSASMAELCALLSVLAEIPLRQGIAITGSVNQHGEAQAIGGVNEKIEGFFDICRARGLNGEQAVLIPVTNVKHLMLRADVVAACAEGSFAVYAYRNVDEAIAVLTGETADTVHDKVSVRLAELEKIRERLARAGKDTSNKND